MKAALFSALLILITGAMFWLTRGQLHSQEIVPSQPEAPASTSPPIQANAAPEEKTDSADAFPKMASLDQYRAEVKDNPHRVPPSVVLFSKKIAGQMKLARASENAAIGVFKNLSECAKAAAEAQPASVNAMCAVNAQELARRYPKSLHDEFEGLRSSLREDVARILTALAD